MTGERPPGRAPGPPGDGSSADRPSVDPSPAYPLSAEPPTEVLPRVGPVPPTGAAVRGDARNASGDSAASEDRRSRGQALVRRLRAQAPLLAVLAVVLVAFVRVAEQHWREGTVELGLALLLGAVLRALCTEQRAGLLAVRGRRTDIVLYAAFGLVVLLVSLTITGGPLAGRR